MLDPYTLEKVNTYRREELLREAQHRHLIEQARSTRPRASGRASFWQRMRLTVRQAAATLQARLSSSQNG